MQLQQSRWPDILQVSGIENEISLTENEWPCFALKELSDNAYDWLNDYYPITTTNNRHTINSGRERTKTTTAELGDISQYGYK